jgi:hypothetical protein
MASTSETGHARNIAAFEQLLSFCQSYGATYNPSRQALTIASLTTQLQAARNALGLVKNAEAAWGNAIRLRAGQYKGLRPLTTRIINALEASGATPATVAGARSIANKIQGRGKKQEAAPQTGTGENAAAPTHRTISRSQASYDQLADHLEKLVELLNTEPGYQPNEPGLSLADLQQYIQQLHTANTQVVDAYTNYSNARMQRDQLFYTPLSGLVPVAQDVKKYIKSVFGGSSAAYQQVSGLELKIQSPTF